jgi:divalent metal cation (Fe/Co/Zn/Cd) transporter
MTTKLLNRGLYLEYATLAWNVIGTLVVIVAPVQAGSVALGGFALDTLIEIFASLVVVWQLRGIHDGREHVALRLIGGAFFALAAYVIVQSLYTIAQGLHPQPSLLGILWLMMTLVAMLLLAWGKQQTGRALDNRVLLAEAKVTLIDGYLAGAVLVGLVLNAVLSWWWADPLAALVIVYYAIREGRHAWHHEEA